MTADWHFSMNSTQKGPVPHTELLELISSGTIGPDGMVWREGMDAWAKVSSVPELAGAVQGPKRIPGSPPPMRSATPAAAGSGTKILVLTIIAAFFSIFIGGCTAAVGEKLGADGADSQAGFGLTQALLGLAGGVWAFRKFNDPSTIVIGGRSFRRLTLAAILIFGAAVLSISNALTFITAGVLNAIAGSLALIRAKSLPEP
jgi:hypothetical protein